MATNLWSMSPYQFSVRSNSLLIIPPNKQDRTVELLMVPNLRMVSRCGCSSCPTSQQCQWGLYFINLVLCEQSLVHWEGPKWKRKKVLAAGIPVGHDDKNPGAAQSANSRSGPLALMDKHQGPEWWAMESCTDWLSFQLLQACEKCEKDGHKRKPPNDALGNENAIELMKRSSHCLRPIS